MNANRSYNDLSFVSLQTTIGQLSLFDVQLNETNLSSLILEKFGQYPDLPGIIVLDQDQKIKGIISRRQFLETVGTNLGVAAFGIIPGRRLIKLINTNPLFLPSTCSIYEAAQISINRTEDKAYEPILVTFPDGTNQLLDNHLLLLAQARLLNLSVSIEKSRRKLAETFYKAGRALSASLRLDQVLDIILDFASDFCEFNQAVLFLRRQGVLEVAATRGKYSDIYPTGLEIVMRDHPLLQQMVVSEEMAIIGRLTDQEALDIFAKPGQSWVGIPLMNSDEVIAVYYMLHDSPQFYENQDISTVVNFISQSALAINNAILFSKMCEDANRDFLTGLYNRRYFFDSITGILEVCQMTHQPLAMMIIDLDHFKDINDQYGHLAGDDLLRSISAILNSHTRNRDFACRYGGEEFLVVLPEVKQTTAFEVAERLRIMVNKQNFHFKQVPTAIHSSISIGISVFPENGDDVEALIRAADIALYQAKRNRNCVWVYSPDLDG